MHIGLEEGGMEERGGTELGGKECERCTGEKGSG